MDRFSDDDKDQCAEKTYEEQEEFENLLNEVMEEYREALENLKGQ